MGSSGSPQPMFTAFTKDGNHVFRLWHTMLSREEGLSTVRRMLNSLRFSQVSVPADTPDDVWQKAVNICEDWNPSTSMTTAAPRRVVTCRGPSGGGGQRR
ncbi:MAG: hypothetical protein R6U51_05800 [Anaerolineales bacterium]